MLAFALVAVATAAMLSGCGQSPRLYAVHDRPVLLVEASGAQERYYLADISTSVLWAPLRHHFVLSRDRVAPSKSPSRVLRETDAHEYLVYDGSRSGVFPAVGNISQDTPKRRIRWILSVKPLVVGIGEETTIELIDGLYAATKTEIRAGMGQRFVTEADLDAKVDTLLVLACKPEPRDKSDPIALGRRVIALKQPQSLAQVMAAAVWLRPEQVPEGASP
jgi:hypothetical protein